MMADRSKINPQAVVFDMDGLMFNTEDVYTLAGSELLARPEIKSAYLEGGREGA